MKRRGKKGSIAFMATGIGHNVSKKRSKVRSKVRSKNPDVDKGFISSMSPDTYRLELKRRIRGF